MTTRFLNFLGFLAVHHHGALHITLDYCPLHVCIATDGEGWRLRDAQGKPVQMHVAFYRMHRQCVLVIGRFSLRLDRNTSFPPAK